MLKNQTPVKSKLGLTHVKIGGFFHDSGHCTRSRIKKGWKNVSEISRRSGYNRRTVRKYLDPERIHISKKRGIRGNKLDPYKEYISKRLDEYPKISAKRLLREIRAKGYEGGYTILKDYLISVRPVKQPLVVYRYETKPDRQAQVDWGEYREVF